MPVRVLFPRRLAPLHPFRVPNDCFKQSKRHHFGAIPRTINALLWSDRCPKTPGPVVGQPQNKLRIGRGVATATSVFSQGHQRSPRTPHRHSMRTSACSRMKNATKKLNTANAISDQLARDRPSIDHSGLVHSPQAENSQGAWLPAHCTNVSIGPAPLAPQERETGGNICIQLWYAAVASPPRPVNSARIPVQRKLRGHAAATRTSSASNSNSIRWKIHSGQGASASSLVRIREAVTNARQQNPTRVRPCRGLMSARSLFMLDDLFRLSRRAGTAHFSKPSPPVRNDTANALRRRCLDQQCQFMGVPNFVPFCFFPPRREIRRDPGSCGPYPIGLVSGAIFCALVVNSGASRISPNRSG
jgi:hypothetical protein